VLIDPDQVRAQVKIDDAELRQYYAQHLSDYRVPDRVKVAHILFKTTDKNPQKSRLSKRPLRRAESDPRWRKLCGIGQEIL